MGLNALQGKVQFEDEFAHASGKYFDNDAKCFADPHGDALDDGKCVALVQVMESML